MLVALIAATFVALSWAGGVELTPSDFDAVVDGSKHVFVKFYAPWCGHCKALQPTWDELGQAYAHASNDVVIAKVNADDHRDLGTRFGVQGFPTLKWFPRGSTEPQDYSGGRDFADLARFISENSGIAAKTKPTLPSAVVALTDATFNDFVLADNSSVLVEFYAPWCGHCKQLAPTYEKLGAVFQNEPSCVVAKLDATENSKSANEYGIQGYPTIKFFSQDSKTEPLDYESGRDLKSFVTYLNEKCGTQRNDDGSLNSRAGIVDQWDAAVSAFLNNPKSKDTVLKQIKATLKDAADLLNPYIDAAAKYYEKFVEKISKLESTKAGDGLAYINKEHGRLIGILEKNAKEETMLPAKVDEFVLRSNILKHFSSLKSESGEKVKDEL